MIQKSDTEGGEEKSPQLKMNQTDIPPRIQRTRCGIGFTVRRQTANGKRAENLRRHRPPSTPPRRPEITDSRVRGLQWSLRGSNHGDGGRSFVPNHVQCFGRRIE